MCVQRGAHTERDYSNRREGSEGEGKDKCRESGESQKIILEARDILNQDPTRQDMEYRAYIHENLKAFARSDFSRMDLLQRRWAILMPERCTVMYSV